MPIQRKGNALGCGSCKIQKLPRRQELCERKMGFLLSGEIGNSSS